MTAKAIVESIRKLMMKRYIFKYEGFLVECWGKDFDEAWKRAADGRATRIHVYEPKKSKAYMDRVARMKTGEIVIRG